jgi:hypothetical protein
MPEIEIRPPTSAEIPKMVEIDHDYVSDHVWQMEVQHESGQKPSDLKVDIIFRQLKLPRSVKVEYPRFPKELASDWKDRSCLLVALLKGEVVGYTSMMLTIAPNTSWMTDLVIMRKVRRQGIGSARLGKAQALSSDGDGNAAEKLPRNLYGAKTGIRSLRIQRSLFSQP